MLQSKICINFIKYGDIIGWTVFSLLLSFLIKDIQAQQLKNPVTDYSRYRIVQPVVHHAKTKREIMSTRHTEGLHHPEVTMTMDINGEENIMDLRLNQDLVGGDYTISYQKNGETVLYKPTKEELDICQYSGKIRGKKDSWVAVSTCHGVRGVLHDGEQIRYIEPAEVKNDSIGSKHFIYDHSDLTKTFHCAHEDVLTNSSHYDPALMKRHFSEKGRQQSSANRYKRDTFEDTKVRGPFNANKQSRFIEFVLVADYGEYKANGENIHTVHRQLKDVANIVNSIFSRINIFIVLKGVVVWTEQDQIYLEDDADPTLSNFLRYRRDTLNNEIPNDNAYLLTRQTFRDRVFGKALIGAMCSSEHSGGVNAYHSDVVAARAISIAHEIGHNFGLEHDKKECKCSAEKCIMSASLEHISSNTTTYWSDCSLKSLAKSFRFGLDYCLRNKPKRLFESPTCGNGFVESGEQCDCGLNEEFACADCCDPNTCTLRSNATCATGKCCNTSTCQLKSASSKCRAAIGECDLAEYCTGLSEYCPEDVHKMDTTPCSNNQAYCVQGACRSHNDQCKLLWGHTGYSSDDRCYSVANIQGTRAGHCGYTRATGKEPAKYHRCSPEDALCGLLQCKHYTDNLVYGHVSTVILSTTFIHKNATIIPCRTAMIDFGTQDVDPGMVPDGAKCGQDKMCLKQKCVSVATIRDQILKNTSSVAASNCSDNGVSNPKDHNLNEEIPKSVSSTTETASKSLCPFLVNDSDNTQRNKTFDNFNSQPAIDVSTSVLLSEIKAVRAEINKFSTLLKDLKQSIDRLKERADITDTKLQREEQGTLLDALWSGIG